MTELCLASRSLVQKRKALPGYQEAQLMTLWQPGCLVWHEDPWLSVPWSPMVWLFTFVVVRLMKFCQELQVSFGIYYECDVDVCKVASCLLML